MSYVKAASVLSFYLLIYFLFLKLMLLWHYRNILFVALLIPSNYEDKRLARHWTMLSWRILWPVAYTTQNMHMCR